MRQDYEACLKSYRRKIGQSTVIKFNNLKQLRTEKSGLKGIHGVYIFRTATRGSRTIYIGRAGQVRNDGVITSQNVARRMERGDRKNIAEWISEHGELEVEILNTWKVKLAPAYVEADLLQSWLNDEHKLPAYNNCF